LLSSTGPYNMVEKHEGTKSGRSEYGTKMLDLA
jgi:hypothetical protein